MDSVWRVLADVVVGLHYAFLAYLVVGGFLAWRWRKTIWVHVGAAVWGVLIIVTKVPCPLTALQNQFRENAGLDSMGTSFINIYVRGTLYPADHESLAQLAIALTVLVSWIGFIRTRAHASRYGPARRFRSRFRSA